MLGVDRWRRILNCAAVGLVLLVAACAGRGNLPPAMLSAEEALPPLYQIGPGDSLTIFVWRQPEVTTGVTVRPDGRITTPLLEDLYVTGMTPVALSAVIEEELGQFIQDPQVTVMVSGFSGPFSQQVRIVGAASQPRALAYRANMTALDVMIAVGGLSTFADGNDTTLIRLVDGEQKEFRLRLDDLIRDGNISANVAILPGDVLIIPERFL